MQRVINKAHSRGECEHEYRILYYRVVNAAKRFHYHIVCQQLRHAFRDAYVQIYGSPIKFHIRVDIARHFHRTIIIIITLHEQAFAIWIPFGELARNCNRINFISIAWKNLTIIIARRPSTEAVQSKREWVTRCASPEGHTTAG